MDRVALNAIYDLLQLGVAADQIQEAFNQSENLEDFKLKLEELRVGAEQLKTATSDGTTTASNSTSPQQVQDYAKDVNAYIKDMTSAQKLLDDLKNGKGIDLDDIFGLAQAHPEILTAIGDIDALKQKLQEIADLDTAKAKESFEGWLMDSADVFGQYLKDSGLDQKSDVVNYLNTAGIKSLKALKEYMLELGDEAGASAIDTWLTKVAAGFKAIEETGESDNAGLSDIKKKYDDVIKDTEKVKTALQSLKDDGKISFSDILDLAETHPEILQVIGDVEQLEAALQGIVDGSGSKLKETMRGLFEQNDTTFKQFLDSYYDFDMSNYYTDVTAFQQKAPSTAIEAWNAFLDSLIEKMFEGVEASNALQNALESLSNTVSSQQSNIDKAQGQIDAIAGGKSLNTGDLLELAKSNSDILTALGQGNMTALTAALEKSIQDAKSKITKAWQDVFEQQWLEDNKGKIKEALGDDAAKSITSIEQLKAAFRSGEVPDWVTDGAAAINGMAAAAEGATASVEELVSTFTSRDLDVSRIDKIIEDGSKESIGKFMQNKYGVGNVDLINRPQISSTKMKNAGWDAEDFYDGGISTVYSSSYYAGTESTFGKDRIDFSKDMILHLTPILPDGTVLSPGALDDYVDTLIDAGKKAEAGKEFEAILNADKGENGGKGRILWLQDASEGLTDAATKADAFDQILHKLQEAYYKNDHLSDLAKSIEDKGALDKASASNYKEQIEAISNAFGDNNFDAALEKWNNMSTSMQDAIAKQYPELITALYKVKKAQEE